MYALPQIHNDRAGKHHVCASLFALHSIRRVGTALCLLPPSELCRVARPLCSEVGLLFQDSCASTMGVAVRLYKRTSNLSKSEIRRTSDGSFKGGQAYDFPLFDNNQPHPLHRTVATGLINVQPDTMGAGFASGMSKLGRYDPRFPRVTAKTSMSAQNGCTMSQVLLLFSPSRRPPPCTLAHACDVVLSFVVVA